MQANRLLDFVQQSISNAKNKSSLDDNIFGYADYCLSLIQEHGLDEKFPYFSARWCYQLDEIKKGREANAQAIVLLNDISSAIERAINDKPIYRSLNN